MHPVLLARPTEHIVAFYRSDDFVVEQVASFVSEGLAANEHVIAIATIPHWNAITARLDDSGIAYGRATSAGQLVFIEAEEALDGTFEGWEGETVFLLVNGQVWQQSRYDYLYHYAYMPRVTIVRNGTRYVMSVEGTSRTVESFVCASGCAGVARRSPLSFQE